VFRQRQRGLEKLSGAPDSSWLLSPSSRRRREAAPWTGASPQRWNSWTRCTEGYIPPGTGGCGSGFPGAPRHDFHRVRRFPARVSDSAFCVFPGISILCLHTAVRPCTTTQCLLPIFSVYFLLPFRMCMNQKNYVIDVAATKENVPESCFNLRCLSSSSYPRLGVS
jgi:hypothetical protein